MMWTHLDQKMSRSSVFTATAPKPVALYAFKDQDTLQLELRASAILTIARRKRSYLADKQLRRKKEGPPGLGGPSLGRNAPRSKTPLEPVTPAQ
jgi:hypothetical protein